MTEIKEFDISCPHCQQKYRVGLEYAGQSTNCPNCSNSFEIPEAPAVEVEAEAEPEEQPSERVETPLSKRKLGPPVLQTLRGQNLDILTEDLGVDTSCLENIHKKQCWELAVIAEVLADRVASFRDELESATKPLKAGRFSASGQPYHLFVQDSCHEFFSLYQSLFHWFQNELHNAMTFGEVKPILKAMDKLKKIFSTLVDFHTLIVETPYPYEALRIQMYSILVQIFSPARIQQWYPEPPPATNEFHDLHRLMVEWMPHLCTGIEAMVGYMRGHVQDDREKFKFGLQLSLLSPTVNQFYMLANILEIARYNPLSDTVTISQSTTKK